VLNDALNRYELQNYTSMAAGKHFVKFGVRVRSNRDENFETANFNGTFRSDPESLPPQAHPVRAQRGAHGIQAYQQLVMGLANDRLFRSDYCGYGRPLFVSAVPRGILLFA